MPVPQPSNVRLQVDPNESADRLTSLLAAQADREGALLVALRALVAPKQLIIARTEDAAGTANGVAYVRHLEMRENLSIASLYVENASGSPLTIYPGIALGGTPIMIVSSGSWRRLPLAYGLKEVTVSGLGSGGPNSAPWSIVLSSGAWEPAMGAII
jgi:hypothetical protein